MAVGGQRAQALERGHVLHAVVGRVRLAARQLDRVRSRHDDRRPAAGARVAAAGAVGPDEDLAVTCFDWLLHRAAMVETGQDASRCNTSSCRMRAGTRTGTPRAA